MAPSPCQVKKVGKYATSQVLDSTYYEGTSGGVKEKLQSHCGTGSAFMHLTLCDENGQVVADMSNDDLKLGYFSPMDGWTIHIDDTDAHSASAGGWLEDVSKVSTSWSLLS